MPVAVSIKQNIPKCDCHHSLSPPPPHLSHRSAGRPGPGFYQNPAFALGSSACEILCASFKSEVSISFSPTRLSTGSPTCLQSHMLWGFIFPVQDSWAKKLNLGLSTLAFKGESLQCNYSLSLWVAHPVV